MCFVSDNSKIFLENFEKKTNFWRLFFSNFEMFKIWDRSLIDMFNLHVFETQSVLSLNCIRDGDSRAPLFLPKSGEHDVTLTSFTANLSEYWKIPLIRVCKIDAGRDM